MNNNIEKIQNALKRLAHSDLDDGFVIFSDKNSGRFVQFAGSNREGLLMDFPAQSLSESELETAQAVFKEYGSSLEASPLLDKPGGEVVDAHFGFSLHFGKEIEAAARVAYYVLLTVFDLRENFELDIEENLHEQASLVP